MGDRIESINDVLDHLLLKPSFLKNVLVERQQFLLASTSYPEYPLQFINLQDYIVVVEGELQGAQDGLEREVKNLVSILFEPSKQDALREWLLRMDGDFLIFILNKRNNEIAILNDALGRLPCYFLSEGKVLLFSSRLKPT